MATSSRSLVSLAQRAEDIASGLRAFREQVRPHEIQITAIIGALFGLSVVLRELDTARYDPSLYRIRDDLALVSPSVQSTLAAADEMFGRTRDRPYQTAWEDLQWRMEREEGLGFLERLRCYEDFCRALFDVMRGVRPTGFSDLRRVLATVADVQRDGRSRGIDQPGMTMRVVKHRLGLGC